MEHYRAIQIDPAWVEDDFARVREWLLVGMFQQTADPYDDIVRNTTFERRDDPTGEIYVAVYRQPIRPGVIFWSSVEELI